MSQKRRVVAYARVSTNSKDQANSYDNQLSFFQREIPKNPGFEFHGIYADKGITGTSLTKRKDFNRMLTDAGLDINDSYKIIAKPKFDIIMTKNTSRFARNVSVDAIFKALAQNGVYVYFLDLNKSTENSADMTFIQIVLALDERESRDRSTKVKFGLEESAIQGNIVYNNNIYGYKYHPKPENRLEIIPEQAEVIRKIFELYIDGLGTRRIAQYLHDNNILNKKGKRFTENALQIILKNETYTGKSVSKKYDRGEIFSNHPKRLLDEDEQIIFRTDKVPAIIDDETFIKAQEEMNKRVNKQNLVGIKTCQTDFAGLIICGNCGGTYYADNNRKLKDGTKARYYACRTKRIPHRDENGKRVMLCNNKNVSEKDLDKFLSSIGYSFRVWNRVKNGIQELKTIIKALNSMIDNQSIEQVNELEYQLKDITIKKEKLLDLYLADTFTKEQLDERAKPLDDRQAELKEAISNLSKSNEDIYKDIAEVKETLKYFETQSNKFQAEFNNGAVAKRYSRKEMLKDIDQIIAGTDGELTVIFKAYAEIDKLVNKHRHFIQRQERKIV